MELKDVIQFYLPIQVELDNAGSKVYNRVAVAVGNTDDKYSYVTLRMGTGAKSFTHSVLLSENSVKPILRPLSDITDAERLLYYDEFLKDDTDIKFGYSHDHKCNYANLHLKYSKFEPKTTLWLLKQGFDLFGLIEAGLAIDKTTMTPHKKTG